MIVVVRSAQQSDLVHAAFSIANDVAKYFAIIPAIPRAKRSPSKEARRSPASLIMRSRKVEPGRSGDPLETVSVAVVDFRLWHLADIVAGARHVCSWG